MRRQQILRRWTFACGLACTLGTGAAAAQDDTEPLFAPRAELMLIAGGDSLRLALNPGNVARRAERSEELAMRLGVDFAGGELLARLSSARRDVDGHAHTATDSRLLRAYKRFELGHNLDLTVGKKILHLDSGYAFHAFDFLEDLAQGNDFDDRRGREEGFPMVALAWRGSDVAGRAIFADDGQLGGTEINRGFKQGLFTLDMTGSNWNGSLLLQKYSIGRMGAGVGGSVTASANLALHGALFVRRGSLRPLHLGVLRAVPQVDVPPGNPVGRWRLDSPEYRARLLLGGQYTSASLLNLLVEYSYDGNGLNDGEWQRFLRQVALHQGLPADPLRTFNLAADGRSLATRRQHYLFARIGFSDVLMRPELSVLAGKDGSAQWSMKLRHELSGRCAVWLSTSVNSGSADTEFGLLPVRKSWSSGLSWKL